MFTDAKETARQRCHASLRGTCAAGDVSLLKSLLQQLGSEAELVVNMAPSGSNTLLFMWVFYTVRGREYRNKLTFSLFFSFLFSLSLSLSLSTLLRILVGL